MYQLIINRIEATIKTLRAYTELCKNQENLKTLLKLKPLTDNYCELLENHKKATIEYNDAITQLQVLENKKNDYINRTNMLNDIKCQCAKLGEKLTKIGGIQKKLDGYKDWLYTKKLLPRILKDTNSIAHSVEGSTDYTLDYKIQNGELFWFMDDKVNHSVEIHRAGGFRKFLYGLALRITLSYIGGTSIMCKQLFLDEGFVAADKHNLQNTPDFLDPNIETFV